MFLKQKTYFSVYVLHTVQSFLAFSGKHLNNSTLKPKQTKVNSAHCQARIAKYMFTYSEIATPID